MLAYTRFLGAAVLCTALVLGGCGAEAPDDASSPAEDNASSDPLTVSDAWVRPVAEGGVTALYATVHRREATPDTLLRIEAPFSDRTEIHETVERDDGTMGMDELEQGLLLPASSETRLQPGGLHGMLYDANRTLSIGDTVEVTLHFAEGASQTVQASVRNTPPPHQAP
ncbi:MAG: copper chaperone PCu(A)C [Longimonas sp.]|uniref:copper chaperone PCu(A)C n=1 Tax=Longimonas sp. TaxID=2039626 RepID=UPI0033463542